MSEDRVDAIPDVPTTHELGYDLSFSTVRGYLVLEDGIEPTLGQVITVGLNAKF